VWTASPLILRRQRGRVLCGETLSRCLLPRVLSSLIASRGTFTRLCQETGLKAIYGSRSHAPEKGAAGHSVYAWLPSLRCLEQWGRNGSPGKGLCRSGAFHPGQVFRPRVIIELFHRSESLRDVPLSG
jgi:hypothetical protein